MYTYTHTYIYTRYLFISLGICVYKLTRFYLDDVSLVKLFFQMYILP